MTHDGQEQLAVMVGYKIPDNVTIKPTPPNVLRRLGFVSHDGSLWIGHVDNMAAVPKDEWEAAGPGVIVTVIRFVPEQWVDMRRLALAGLERRVDEIRSSLRKGLVKATERLEEAERLQSAKLTRNGVGRIRGHIREAKKRIVQAQSSAAFFDLTGEVAHLIDALRHELEVKEEEHQMTISAAKEAMSGYPDYAKRPERREPTTQAEIENELRMLEARRAQLQQRKSA